MPMTPPADIREIYLQPGELWFGRENARIRTILGSCVAVTLWHPQQRMGGMCHYLLPTQPGAGPGGRPPDGRYGDQAVDQLLDHVRVAGMRTTEFEAKLFGGGRMFRTAEGAVSVSEKNVEAARTLARRHGLRVAAEHLGGIGHRHLMLDLWSGTAWLKHSPNPPAFGEAAEAEIGGLLWAAP